MSIFPVRPREIRFIKLGSGGKWEAGCRKEGIIRFGFETADPESMAMCREGRWDDLAAAWQAARKSKGRGTTDANEIRRFWTDPGDILWVTFVGEDLCWGFLEPGEPEPYSPGDAEDLSTFRRIKGGWRSVDAAGVRLGKSNLPGYVTKVTGYRGTSCSIEGSSRLLGRINGERAEDVERVAVARHELREALIPLIQRLNPIDFEVLVDMMFARAGWRRVGHIGKTQRDKDLDLEMPLTGEKAIVQVKTQTSASEIEEYIQRSREWLAYSRLFLVFHSLKGQFAGTEEDGVTIMDGTGVADRVVEFGLVDWVIDRVF
ncbi:MULTISPECIES: hypothetical protein [unclassified Dyella]|uniref:restriction endonuclease n=1 Tax=Dyella sp. ASV21 TaxID=2795114 RepID=UPI0018EC6471|nr:MULTISPECIES: hypothetical protein [unclassified Dyella]